MRRAVFVIGIVFLTVAGVLFADFSKDKEGEWDGRTTVSIHYDFRELGEETDSLTEYLARIEAAESMGTVLDEEKDYEEGSFFPYCFSYVRASPQNIGGSIAHYRLDVTYHLWVAAGSYDEYLRLFLYDAEIRTLYENLARAIRELQENILVWTESPEKRLNIETSEALLLKMKAIDRYISAVEYGLKNNSYLGKIDCKAALKLWPEFIETKFLLTMLEFSEGNYQEAWDSLQGYVSAYPDNLAALCYRTVLAWMLGKENAEAYYHKAVALGTKEENADEMSMLLLANMMNRLQKWPEAIDYFGRALVYNPDNYFASLLLGNIYVMQGQADLAEYYLNQVLEHLDSDTSEAQAAQYLLDQIRKQ